MALPSFLIKKTPKQENIRKLRRRLDNAVHTVCEEARCPNIGECFSQGTCTFLILGDVCTRSCAFCGVARGQPQPPDPNEPQRIAEAAAKLNLSYVVITSVTRDDLPDGGANHFADVLRQLRITPCLPAGRNYAVPAHAYRQAGGRQELRIEVLIPDFKGNEAALRTVLDANPDVLNHNVETTPRLQPQIRPQADYQRSLDVLRQAKEIKPEVYTKSGFMVGLGETDGEVFSVLGDLRTVGCDIVTIGQYLPPSKSNVLPERYVTPEEFIHYRAFGESLGLRVFSGPFVRSSYHASQLAKIREN